MPIDLIPAASTELIQSELIQLKLIQSTTRIIENIPIVGNGLILTDSACTTGRAAVNFCYSPNPIARVCFATSCVFGVAGAVTSGTAVVTTALGIPAAGVIGASGARTFNRLGKYLLHMGSVTSGKITNVTEIADLME